MNSANTLMWDVQVCRRVVAVCPYPPSLKELAEAGTGKPVDRDGLMIPRLSLYRDS
jgi:hypothetical protein